MNYEYMGAANVRNQGYYKNCRRIPERNYS